MEKITAKNKSEFGAKKRELVSEGYKVYEYKAFSKFVKYEGFKEHEIILTKGWKKA